MPGALLPAFVATGAVLPKSLATSFRLSSQFPILSNTYHDGTLERSLIISSYFDAAPPVPARIWTLAERLTTVNFAALTAFWENTALGGLNPFYFYDPYDPIPGQPIGSNYDASGFSTQGRVTAHFRGKWEYNVTPGRVNVPSLMLVEVY